jgi:tetratricopeptide (TPR) repeat protein
MEKAEQFAASAVALALEMSDFFGLALARIGAGHTHLRMGEPERAIHELEKGLEECREKDMPTVAVGVVAELALSYAEVGEGDKAIKALMEIVEVADDAEIPIQSLDRRLFALAKAHYVCGSFDQALHFAQEACAASEQHGDDGTLAWALLFAAMAEAKLAGTGAETNALFDRARTLANEHSLVPLSAYCELEFARTRLERGRSEEARESAQKAARAFHSFGLRSMHTEAEALANTAAREAGSTSGPESSR